MTSKISSYDDWTALLELAEAGDGSAQKEAASYYDFGLTLSGVTIVPEDKLKAFEWYNRAYRNGNDDAIIRIADFLSEGIYCDLNIELAIGLYKKGIAKGSSIAATNLATVFRNEHDYTKAFELYNIAQDIDKSNSLELAICYYFGIGTEKNSKKAYEILLEISQNISQFGHFQYDIDEANYLLGKIYLDGDVVERSIQKACYFLKLADTDNDHPSAQHLLAVIGRTN
jgi:TPR repeat protein